MRTDNSPLIAPDAPATPSLEREAGCLAAEMKEILRQAIRFPSTSGNEGEFVRFLADWAGRNGLEIDLWQGREEDLPICAQTRARHIPLAGRPTLLITSPGDNRRPSLLFNAHSDVVAAPNPQCWTHAPWAGEEDGGRIYGRGACDVKGPLVSALWAMLAVHRASDPAQRGPILLELVPGEEDCVGLGSLTSIAHGVRADGLVVLEPTETRPRCASRGGCRFEITCAGRAVHGTVKWLGQDAIAMMRCVLDCLDTLQERWNQRDADPLFAGYPIARPVTVDRLRGGDWQGMICDNCVCAGYFELLPGDSIETWKSQFCNELGNELSARGGNPDRPRIQFSEEYAGCRLAADHPLCRAAETALAGRAVSPQPPVLACNGPPAERSLPQMQNFVATPALARPAYNWTAFNSGCEAGVRARLHGTPTLVWGPGSLEQAHAVDEFVRFSDVQLVAEYFASLMMHWTGDMSFTEVSR
ncbi:MAG: M20 family metallopeptidase [Tepidisphaerales bacterium]